MFTRKSLGPFSVSVGLPPVRVFSVDDVEDVATLERDPQLVARNVEVVVRVVGKVSPVVILQMKMSLRISVPHRSMTKQIYIWSGWKSNS